MENNKIEDIYNKTLNYLALKVAPAFTIERNDTEINLEDFNKALDYVKSSSKILKSILELDKQPYQKFVDVLTNVPQSEFEIQNKIKPYTKSKRFLDLAKGYAKSKNLKIIEEKRDEILFYKIN